jgi:hypothetical protein
MGPDCTSWERYEHNDQSARRHDAPTRFVDGPPFGCGLAGVALMVRVAARRLRSGLVRRWVMLPVIIVLAISCYTLPVVLWLEQPSALPGVWFVTCLWLLGTGVTIGSILAHFFHPLARVPVAVIAILVSVEVALFGLFLFVSVADASLVFPALLALLILGAGILLFSLLAQRFVAGITVMRSIRAFRPHAPSLVGAYLVLVMGWCPAFNASGPLLLGLSELQSGSPVPTPHLVGTRVDTPADPSVGIVLLGRSYASPPGERAATTLRSYVAKLSQDAAPLWSRTLAEYQPAGHGGFRLAGCLIDPHISKLSLPPAGLLSSLHQIHQRSDGEFLSCTGRRANAAAVEKVGGSEELLLVTGSSVPYRYGGGGINLPLPGGVVGTRENIILCVVEGSDAVGTPEEVAVSHELAEGITHTVCDGSYCVGYYNNFTGRASSRIERAVWKTAMGTGRPQIADLCEFAIGHPAGAGSERGLPVAGLWSRRSNRCVW